MDILKAAAVSAIDWFSVKLGSVSTLLIFSPDLFFKVMGAAAAASTLIYNGINIYLKIKELKRK
jgi:hypothetical protein